MAVEGAFLVLSQLQDVAWDASESIDYDDIELADDPFKPIVPRSWTPCFNMRKKLNYQRGAKNSLSSSNENAKKSYKPTW